MIPMSKAFTLLAFTVALTFPALSFGGYEADQLKKDIARNEARYQRAKEGRAQVAKLAEEYAFDDTYMFVDDRMGTIIPVKKKEFSTWVSAMIWRKLARGEQFSDDFDPEIWVENEMGEFRKRSESIREDLKKSVGAYDNYLESLAVEIQFLKDRLAELEAVPGVASNNRFPDAAGTLWEQNELGFKGTWTRMGESSMWNAKWDKGCDDSTIEITVTGNAITASRKDGACKFSKGLTAEYTGTIQPDGTTIKGSRKITNSGTGDVRPTLNSTAAWSATITR